MSVIGKIFTGVGTALGIVKPPAPKPGAMASSLPPPVPTRNVAAENARRRDVLRRRRGQGANELTGGGAEAATPGGKTLLGQ
jgi:hypothetical protein